MGRRGFWEQKLGKSGKFAFSANAQSSSFSKEKIWGERGRCLLNSSLVSSPLECPIDSFLLVEKSGEEGKAFVNFSPHPFSLSLSPPKLLFGSIISHFCCSPLLANKASPCEKSPLLHGC